MHHPGHGVDRVGHHDDEGAGAPAADMADGSVAKSGWLVTCLRDLERGVEA